MCCGGAAPSRAQVFHSQQGAIESAFPDSDRIESRVVVLDDEQAKRIEKQSRTRLDTRILKIYSGWKGDALLGYAIIDIHQVRSKDEALMLVLGPEGALRSILVLAFYEPPEYLPSERWFRQFEGKALEDGLRPGRDVHAVVGSTLTTRAVTGAARRALAIHEVVIEPGLAR